MWIAIEIPDDVIPPKRQDSIEVYISFIGGQVCSCDYPFVVVEERKILGGVTNDNSPG